MFLIVGLGNPGDKYKYNRHNVGFLFLDYLCEKHSLDSFKKKKNFLYSHNQLDKRDIVLIKPTTFMNLSGLALTSAMAFFKVTIPNIIIIFDDVAIPFGKIRIREKGSDGGHNGLKSIQSQLGKNNYKRIRIGIGTPEYSGQMVSHVLGNFNSDDLALLNNEIFSMTDETIKLFLRNKIKEAMNKYNGFEISKDKEESK